MSRVNITAWLAMFVCCLISQRAGAEEFNTYPIDGSVQHSADGRHWVMNLIDTQGNTGTLSIDAFTGAYDAIWGNTVESGFVSPGMELVEKTAAFSDGTLPADDSGDGGGTRIQSSTTLLNHPTSTLETPGPQAIQVIIPVAVIAIAACTYLTARMQNLAASTAAGCPFGSSGGWVGVCGSGALPTCLALPRIK